MPALMPALIGFGSALLAILLTPPLQHYFWRRQRHAELSLATIERRAKLIPELSDRLLVIQGSRRRTEADNDLLCRWEGIWLEIRSLFSKATQDRFNNLNELISEFANPVNTEGFRLSDFDSARIGALTALYEEIGLTGD
jgi:hypothetical protein